ncbi:MAG TPA: CHRD domain-containing protein [Acetobacteraceae bacterium]|nr:CHRD domain-containing protein [Acetobacteraceae bacterium]
MTTVFSTILTGDQEVPPSGSTAIGLGVVLWNEDADTASYWILAKGVDFGDPAPRLDAQTAFRGDDVVAMHVHNQARGQNGPVVFGQIGPPQDTDDLRIALNADGSWAISGAWEPTDPPSISPAGISITITDFAALLDAAEPGDEVPLYFNIHTRDFPAGEIRGQWVALATVDHDGSDDPLRLSLDAGATEALFESLLRLLARDALSDRDPSREPGDDLDLLAAFADLVPAGMDPHDHHHTQADSWGV